MSQQPLSASPASSPSTPPRTAIANMFAPMSQTHGVRRLREGSTAVEIAELDSCTMRQNSYNYFQQHEIGSAPSLLHTSTFRSSLDRSSASSKRQRTLAEQLGELCLQSRAVDAKKRSESRSARRLAREKRKFRTTSNSRIVELDEFGQEKAPSLNGSGSESTGKMNSLKAYGDVERLRNFFSARSGKRSRPVDRMYRHYVTVAAKATVTTTPQGNELVLFRPPVPVTSPFAKDLPAHLSLTRHDFKELSMTEKRQWYEAYRRYMREADLTAEQKKENGLQVQLEVKPTDSMGGFGCNGAFSNFGHDVEMMEVIEDDAEPKQPHAAGALTHTEWFTGSSSL